MLRDIYPTQRQNLLNFLQGVEVDRDRGVEVVDEAMAMCKNK